uniref:Uncharacterized protein n=1 Tax=Timema cristinae TaxID=61476 RepID=A0A7R9GV92_TIMCR|nr:unnamed protein product [Timema cristinae]
MIVEGVDRERYQQGSETDVDGGALHYRSFIRSAELLEPSTLHYRSFIRSAELLEPSTLHYRSFSRSAELLESSALHYRSFSRPPTSFVDPSEAIIRIHKEEPSTLHYRSFIRSAELLEPSTLHYRSFSRSPTSFVDPSEAVTRWSRGKVSDFCPGDWGSILGPGTDLSDCQTLPSPLTRHLRRTTLKVKNKMMSLFYRIQTNPITSSLRSVPVRNFSGVRCIGNSCSSVPLKAEGLSHTCHLTYCAVLFQGTNGPRPSYGVGPGSGGLQPSKPGGPRGPVGGMAQSQPLANSTAPAQGYRGSWGNPYTSLRYPSPNMGGPVPTTASYTTSYSHHQAVFDVCTF